MGVGVTEKEQAWASSSSGTGQLEHRSWASEEGRIVLIRMVKEGFLEEAELALDLQTWRGADR